MLVERDAIGVLRFNCIIRNQDDVVRILSSLEQRDEFAVAVASCRQQVLELFEDVFKHRSYTGRSGAMYAYEGLGSIYWHMVSKLLLAIQEVIVRAEDSDKPLNDLVKMYYRVRSGLGFEKTAAEYGAFPTDPYSHTPPNKGAQQPGMTGQVKEEILTRLGELGVRIGDGIIRFKPTFLRRKEFLEKEDTYRYFDMAGRSQSIALPADSLAFTYCQVPIIYRLSDAGEVRVTMDGVETTVTGVDCLDDESSRGIFNRTGEIERIDVDVPRSSLL